MENTGTTRLAVEVKNLVKVYEKKIRALDGVDLNVSAGKIFALLGPNGAGKTTLMRILTTQIAATSGEAKVYGLDVAQGDAGIRKLVSYVPQEMSVWTDVSGFENLLIYAKIYGIPPDERKKIIPDVLEMMGLTTVANNLVRTYSGGMIRRLEIACTMLIKPKIMFLDEPTIGLDPSARKIVWEKLVSFKKEYGTTIFFNTHYMDEADNYSDEIAIINAGKIVKIGTAEELKRSVGNELILLSVENGSAAAGGAAVGGYAGGGLSEAVLKKVRSLKHVNDVIVNNVNNSDMRIVVEDAETALPKIIEALRKSGVETKRISITKPTLDDVFLKYAGTRLESDRLDTDRGLSEVSETRRMIQKG